MNGAYYIDGERTPRIISFTLHKENNTIEVVYRENSGIILTCNPPRTSPDRVWKEIYGIDPKTKMLCLLKTIEGKHTPETTVPEKITFE